MTTHLQKFIEYLQGLSDELKKKYDRDGDDSIDTSDLYDSIESIIKKISEGTGELYILDNPFFSMSIDDIQEFMYALESFNFVLYNPFIKIEHPVFEYLVKYLFYHVTMHEAYNIAASIIHDSNNEHGCTYPCHYCGGVEFYTSKIKICLDVKSHEYNRNLNRIFSKAREDYDKDSKCKILEDIPISRIIIECCISLDIYYI